MTTNDSIRGSGNHRGGRVGRGVGEEVHWAGGGRQSQPGYRRSLQDCGRPDPHESYRAAPSCSLVGAAFIGPASCGYRSGPPQVAFPPNLAPKLYISARSPTSPDTQSQPRSETPSRRSASPHSSRGGLQFRMSSLWVIVQNLCPFLVSSQFQAVGGIGKRKVTGDPGENDSGHRQGIAPTPSPALPAHRATYRHVISCLLVSRGRQRRRPRLPSWHCGWRVTWWSIFLWHRPTSMRNGRARHAHTRSIKR